MSCEAPRVCPSSNCSSPTTSSPRRASCHAVADPIAPSPTTATSTSHRGHACSSRGSSQRRMSSAASSIGANQPWVNARDDMPRCTDSQTAQS